MDDLYDFVARHPRLFILTGAGISTASGIPGYRDAHGQWQGRSPILFQDFLHLPATRQRYWARSMAGWPNVARAAPNGAHHAVARLEQLGRVQRLVTQNVDGLHQRAGSTDAIELHGGLRAVRCLDCGAEHARAALQPLLESLNPRLVGAAAPTAPDGDAHLAPGHVDHFRIPDCPRCAGLLKPDVVFFGESVPRSRVDAAAQALEQADAVLVVGSSLMVYSGFRFCEWASRMGKPIAAVNLGVTRADALLALKVEQPCAEALAGLVHSLDG